MGIGFWVFRGSAAVLTLPLLNDTLKIYPEIAQSRVISSPDE